MPSYRVRVSTDNGAALARHLDAPSLMCMLSGLSALCEETACRFGSSVSSVCVDPGAHTQTGRAFRFTNICGKIVHYAHPEFYRPGVQALVTEAKNEFGCSDSLYSADCNLVTTRSRTNTLFRGGNNTARIMQCIEHAFAPEAVKDATVHMLVGNVRLAHPVNVLCGFVDRMMTEDARWECRVDMLSEEQAYMKSMRLSRMRPACVGAGSVLADHLPAALLVNINKNGSINLFMTLDHPVPLSTSVEALYEPIFREVIDVIDRYT